MVNKVVGLHKNANVSFLRQKKTTRALIYSALITVENWS